MHPEATDENDRSMITRHHVKILNQTRTCCGSHPGTKVDDSPRIAAWHTNEDIQYDCGMALGALRHLQGLLTWIDTAAVDRDLRVHGVLSA